MEFEIKPREEYVNKTFRIPKSLVDRLANSATENNISMNEFVVQACEFALQHLKKTD